MSELIELASGVVQQALGLGADEATATASLGSHTTITRRDGRIEQATEATTRGLSVSLMVDGRYSSHSTSDLRPDALVTFLNRAIAATGYLEQDLERRQPDVELCGRGATQEALDQDDPAYATHSAEDRAALSEQLGDALEARRESDVISHASWSADGASEVARVMSNGFSGLNRGAWFSTGGEAALLEGDKRPEAAAYYGARFLSDLPSADQVADEVYRRARERLSSGPVASGTYPLVLSNRAAGRLLGVLASPLAGSALYEGRSCMTDRLDTAIGSNKLTILDDPTIPRGLGSRPWDGDALVARPRTIVDAGVLKSFYINVYYGRKLKVPPTTGGRSNWVVPPGTRSWTAIASELPKAILVTGFLGGNANPITGDFSFGIRGVLLEHGEPARSLSEMNITGNALQFFHQLAEVADDPWAWSAVRSPSLVFNEVQFSGT